MQSATSKRFWEVDFLRGIAITMMVLYHLLWDLRYFGVADVDVFAGFWLYFARATATLFLLLVGVSLRLRASRPPEHGPSSSLFPRQFRRGVTIFLWGLVITAITWAVIGEGLVVFGILHLIGVSIVLSYPFLRLGVWNVVPALLCIAAGPLVGGLRVDFPWLVWLGVKPFNFTSVDYFPLLPWFGVVLLGVAIGSTAYGPAGRRFSLPPVAGWPPLRLLSFLGRRSLLIYLLHQPVLILLLILLGLVDLSLLR